MSEQPSILTYTLPGIEDTAGLAVQLSRVMAPRPELTLLLSGELGAGKTTFTRSFVQAMEGGSKAEVASPSFNICNCYPTTPPVTHCDLYRLQGIPPDDDLIDEMHGTSTLVIVEWAQYLPDFCFPEDYILVKWEPSLEERIVQICAFGKNALSALDEFKKLLCE